MCTLFIPDQDKVISVASEHLEPICPEKGDRVSMSTHFFHIHYLVAISVFGDDTALNWCS